MDELQSIRADLVNDLTCDFVEQVVGANDFSRNWQVARERFQKELGPWLQAKGQSPDLQADILARVEELSQQRTSWITDLVRHTRK